MLETKKNNHKDFIYIYIIDKLKYLSIFIILKYFIHFKYSTVVFNLSPLVFLAIGVTFFLFIGQKGCRLVFISWGPTGLEQGIWFFLLECLCIFQCTCQPEVSYLCLSLSNAHLMKATNADTSSSNIFRSNQSRYSSIYLTGITFCILRINVLSPLLRSMECSVAALT